MNRHFNDYRLENVYLRSTAGQRESMIAFWLREQAIRRVEEARRRSHETVFMIHRGDPDDLAGLCTVALKPLRNGHLYYAYRMYLRRIDRTPYLMRVVTNATRDFLKDFRHPDGQQPHGMLIVTENRKLMRPGIKRYFQRHGYRYRGKNPRGLDVWSVEFNNSDNY